MDFLTWNDEICNKFFSPDKSGTRVFLYITRDVIDKIGAPFKVGFEDFTIAVKTGPPWVTRHGQSICQQALQTLEDWRSRGLQLPPYLGYLAFFVLADTVVVPGFRRYSYYPGLRSILGEEPSAGGYPSFDKMHQLWLDLEQWSVDDRHGELGVFKADRLSRMEHVGLPKAQTILTDDERGRLPLLFAEYGFDSFAPPSEKELAAALSHETHHHLLPHTRELLRSQADDDRPLREMLINLVLEELEEWDGSAPPPDLPGEHSPISLGNLRLTMTLDAEKARFGLRCRSNREYPEEGLRFTTDENPVALCCRGDWQGWSTPLYLQEDCSRSFDATKLDWHNTIVLTDLEHSWKVSLAKRPIRVLASASRFGYEGSIEVGQFSKNDSVYLLATNAVNETVRRWGAQCCGELLSFDETTGIPGGWRLYSAKNIKSDEIIRDEFPFLAFPTALRIQLQKGLKVKGYQYLVFALPKIEVTGMDDDMEVFCNDHMLSQIDKNGYYEISDVLRARKLLIEVRQGDRKVLGRSIYAIDQIDWQNRSEITRIDRFGLPARDEDMDYSVGPLINGFVPPPFNLDAFLPPNEGRRLIFIGRNPGEIASCPPEPIPNDWPAVWAVIPMRKRGRVIFCGSSLNASAPTDKHVGDHRSVKKWKEFLWHDRKRVDPPRNPAIKRLWKAYQKVAEHVC